MTLSFDSFPAEFIQPTAIKEWTQSAHSYFSEFALCLARGAKQLAEPCLLLLQSSELLSEVA